MDGSIQASTGQRSAATRAALDVDRDALGLMRHASQLGHLIEWWLQGEPGIEPLAAFRIGRRLERFRLAARLAEGRGSQQVLTTLEGLRSEVVLHPVPDEVMTEIESARKESERLNAGAPAAASSALVQHALRPETMHAPLDGMRPRPARRAWVGVLGWLTLVALAAGAWWLYKNPQELAPWLERLQALRADLILLLQRR